MIGRLTPFAQSRPCLAIPGREGVSDVVRKNTFNLVRWRLTAFHHLRSLRGLEGMFFGLALCDLMA